MHIRISPARPPADKTDTESPATQVARLRRTRARRLLMMVRLVGITVAVLACSCAAVRFLR